MPARPPPITSIPRFRSTKTSAACSTRRLRISTPCWFPAPITCMPEIDIHDVLEVAAGPPPRPFGTAPAGRCPARTGRHIGEVEAAEIEVGAALPTTSRGSGSPGAGKAVFRVETELVVHGTLLGVAQYVVGFLHVLEAILGRLVTWVEVGVVFAGELAIGLADFLRIGFAGYAQRFVVVVLGSRHRFQTCGLAP